MSSIVALALVLGLMSLVRGQQPAASDPARWEGTWTPGGSSNYRIWFIATGANSLEWRSRNGSSASLGKFQESDDGDDPQRGSGTLTGAQLEGTWQSDPLYTWGRFNGVRQGTFRITLIPGATPADDVIEGIQLDVKPSVWGDKQWPWRCSRAKVQLPGPAGSTPPTPPASDCPPNLQSEWLGPISGVFSYRVDGARVTGSVENLGGRYGAATITGMAVGTTMDGTWQSATARGTIQVTGPFETEPGQPCTTFMTFTVTDPPGRTGGEESTSAVPRGGASGAGGADSGSPWTTAQGRDCFEQWIALATRLLNVADLGPESNSRKPWRFNEYGLLEGKGVVSAFAPDDWERHGRSKYWEMWDLYDTDATGGRWGGASVGLMMASAQVPTLRDYVRRCSPVSTSRPPPDGMLLVAPDLVVARGAQVLVPIRLQRAADVLNMDVELSYYPDVVTGRPSSERGSLVTQIVESNLARAGLYKFSFAQLSPINGDGTVIGFRFDATSPGRTPLALSVATVNNSQGTRLPITTINGSITVYDPSNPNDPNNPANPDRPGGVGAGLQPTCSGTGRQTVLDAQCCLQVWVELKSPKEAYQQMDVNGDGAVDSADAVRILQNVARDLPQ